MYIFSVTAKAKKSIEGFAEGDSAPFIVYIDFKDLFGAEQLCKLFVMKEGFYDVVIEKRKLLSEAKIVKLKAKDKSIREARDSGYAIQLFEAH